MTLSLQMKEFFYSLSATDKYSDFDSRKSFNRVNQPEIETSLLGATHANDSTSSLSKAANLASSEEGVHEVRLAWRHIKKWLHKHSEDMNNSLLAPCTEADINELQKDLDCEFPACLKEFLRLTDGQSQFNENGCCGLFYGLRLLSIDEIAVMTESWRKVHESILQNTEFSGLQKYAVNSGFADNNLGTSAGFKMRPSEMKVNQNEFPEQYSVPPHTVHSIYAHSQWIPLITDETGNFIGIDLSPGASDSSAIPAAKWGQVILFGRDFDIKYRIADTFGDFLLIFANDLEKGNWDLRSSSDNEDMVSGVDAELVFVDHETKKELPYLNVLKDRATSLWISSLSAENLRLEANQNLMRKLREKTPLMAIPESKADKLLDDNLRDIDTVAFENMPPTGGESKENEPKTTQKVNETAEDSA